MNDHTPPPAPNQLALALAAERLLRVLRRDAVLFLDHDAVLDLKRVLAPYQRAA